MISPDNWLWYGFLDVTTILFYVVVPWSWAKWMYKGWVNLTKIPEGKAP